MFEESEFDFLLTRLDNLVDILKPASCYLGGIKDAKNSYSVNNELEPQVDAYNAIARAGVDIHEIKHLVKNIIKQQEK